VVLYDHPFFSRFTKSLSIVGGVLSGFVAAWLLDSVDTSTEKKY
jgi:hypothetical protein